MPSGIAFFSWNLENESPPKDSLVGVDAVIHLAGESIAAGRWTKTQKKKIYDSRVLGTKHLVQGISDGVSKPKVIVAASAIGIYGDREDEVLTETSSFGSGFLSELCQAWENALAPTKEIRRVNLRFGIVLGQQGGALSKLLPLFKLGLGGPVGTGNQWMSWIYIKDLISLILFAISNEKLNGSANAVAPNPVTSRQFAKALGAALGRPAWLPAPAIALKIAMGEMSEIVLGSQRVHPKKATESGFVFKYPLIETTLKDLLASM